MTVVVPGVVVEGRVVPDSPLPEGARVEVFIDTKPPEITPRLAAEFKAWGRPSDWALEMVEGADADAAG
jgi:hypothetical protein